MSTDLTKKDKSGCQNYYEILSQQYQMSTRRDELLLLSCGVINSIKLSSLRSNSAGPFTFCQVA